MFDMDTKSLQSTLVSLILIIIITLATAAFNEQYHSDKILLSDVKALTLHHAQMTNARRSPPVPQLKCVGGSAHYKFTPKVVQCINKGSDGYDIQWECKTDMDNAYRFGHVEVTCEGYDYPNDPYVLKGSCGLEYTIEFTEEGLARERKNGGYVYHTAYSVKGPSGGMSGIVVFVGALFLMYIIYKICIAPSYHIPAGSGTQEPPPYGFRPEYMPGQAGTPPPPAYDCFGSPTYASAGYTSASNTGTGSGFWTGAATGGLLGYLFGRGNNYNYNPGYGTRSPWFGQQYYHSDSSSGTGSSFFSSSSSRGSSGTRTASGFGGTSRR